MTEGNETFGQRLRRLRLNQNLTLNQLADTIKVSLKTVQRWEKGERQPRIKIATEIKEEIIDMRANRVPAISNLTCTPQGGGFTLYGEYSLWTDKKKVKALIKQLLAGRDLILANGKALGGIKEEK